MSGTRDTEVIDAWQRNALAWTETVRAGGIESRRLVTDRAMLDAVVGRARASVLDVACGEGWLARALSGRGIEVVGIDVVPALIKEARIAGGGDFRVLSIEDMAAGRLGCSFDVVACNFAALGEQSVIELLRAVPSLLNPGGAFILQTLHPLVACGDQPYRDGWREDAWTGLGPEFSGPAPWYFRTLESWVALFTAGDLRLTELREPLHPETGRPASVVFIAGAETHADR